MQSRRIRETDEKILRIIKNWKNGKYDRPKINILTSEEAIKVYLENERRMNEALNCPLFRRFQMMKGRIRLKGL